MCIRKTSLECGYFVHGYCTHQRAKCDKVPIENCQSIKELNELVELKGEKLWKS